ncbi:PAS domain-containing sensor histidine kinase [Spirulina subsalsa FACHB-351]|uniref:histidine kinase n=1 Tax=Spirulina subsalsa FACHB-351 TaxID=234711 RepID=A0ABT3LAR3_9CYAN|nr:PAS domain-containing sensor histidine kinase [Spirulina subsalsa]MCW6038583.1 PAS domain-containing sensor histidine kinase [Spirulina subsalsa FACHB-351]
MNSLLEKLYVPGHIEYLILDPNLVILDKSPRVERFAEFPQDVAIGQDARLSFPELVGSETIVQQIIAGNTQNSYLEGITRSSQAGTPLYIDFNFERIGNNAILLMEDVTEIMVLKQSLLQRANEAELLLSALKASEDYNKKIISSMGDALFVTTGSGKIKTINQAAQQLFGYSEDELIGQPIALIIEDEQFLLEASQQKLSSQQFLAGVEVLCHRKNGGELIVEFSCSVIQTRIQGSPAFVYIGRDITARKNAEIEMNKALEKEKELNDLKSRFISMTSHEFRNPLSSILMSVDILENFADEWSEDRKDSHLQRIRQCTTTMTSLLDDILIIGRAEVGKLEFKPSPLKLTDFLQYIVEDIQLLAGSDYKIALNLSPSLDGKIFQLDEKLLRHILTNLLTNAVKYSPQGGQVDFEVRIENNWLHLTIQDQGIGIPPADQEHLFECFHRAPNVGDISGTGLGLSIVKKAVDLYRGKIVCRSELGVGTTFQVDLPLNGIPKS